MGQGGSIADLMPGLLGVHSRTLAQPGVGRDRRYSVTNARSLSLRPLAMAGVAEGAQAVEVVEPWVARDLVSNVMHLGRWCLTAVLADRVLP